jgi:flagellar biosynthesis component FlhA
MALSGKTKFWMVTILLLIAFLAGYLPMYVRNRELLTNAKGLQSGLDQARQRLRVATLQNDLGMILVEVTQNNFGIAKDRSSRFFDDLQQATSSVSDNNLRQTLITMLARRNEITSDLTRLNPEIAAKLRILYLDFSKVAAHP